MGSDSDNLKTLQYKYITEMTVLKMYHKQLFKLV